MTVQYRSTFCFILAGIIFCTFLLYLCSWLPWIVVWTATQENRYSTISDLPEADVAIVFGGLYYENQELTETNRDRLLAAKEIFLNDKVDSIVVSNTEQAALAMKQYLVDNGIPAEKIELDTEAVVTQDTCVKESKLNRSVIFVSHGYHLPRILYECSSLALNGVGLAAEDLRLVEYETNSWHARWRIRFQRVRREAVFLLFDIGKSFDKV